MLDRFFGKSIHLYVHLFACILIAVGLPWSKIPLSLGTMLIIINLALESDFKSYWNNLKNNKLAFGLWLYIALEWISLCWSYDFHYALNDIRVKLPLFILPLALVVKPIVEPIHFKWIIIAFLTACFTTSFINIGTYFHWWGNHIYDDIRGLSLFGSHIRYSLLIVFASVICCVGCCRNKKYRIVQFLLAIWFLGYIYYSQILSGYIASISVAFVFILLFILTRKSARLKYGLSGALFLISVVIFVFIINFFKPVPHKISLKNLPHYTINGNWYRHETNHVLWENGYPTVAFISDIELSKAWNPRSDIDYETGIDKKLQPLHLTLWRYMASKGITKDSLGFTKMTAADIQHVENGIASVQLAQSGFKARLYDLKHQLEFNSNPNGHSLLQRVEYWKASCHILKSNWFIGVGAGDVDTTFRIYYNTHKTLLDPENQLRAHNQFFTVWICTGIIGLICFLWWWFIPLRQAFHERRLLFISFIVICLASFLSEDTLETQTGVTFVAFFFGLFAGRSALKLELD